MQLISALIIVSGLFWLHFRALEKTRVRGYDLGHAQGYQIGLAESNQRLYAKGHEDGLMEGRLKERLELETRERKAQKTYDQGYEDAIADIAAADAQTAIIGPTIRLSA